MRKVLLNSSRRDITALPTLALLPFSFRICFSPYFFGNQSQATLKKRKRREGEKKSPHHPFIGADLQPKKNAGT